MWEEDSSERLKKRAFKICQEFLEGPWQKITLDEFEFDVVKGGLSNKLYHCAMSQKVEVSTIFKTGNSYPQEVLLRIYGPVQEDMDIIIRETAVFMLLAEKGLGPKLYGVFPHGRLEEFIPSRSLWSVDLKGLSLSIAREMAKIHSLQVPVTKDPSTMFAYFESWLKYLEVNIHRFDCSESIRKPIQRKDTRKEFIWLKEKIKRIYSPVVFCHNDLHGGNILLRTNSLGVNNSKKILLIDFEFGNYHYRGFDIANHFCECCFDYNTKTPPYFDVKLENFPSHDEQVQFIEAYLQQCSEEGATGDMEEEKIKLVNEVMVFRLFALLLWSVWSYKAATNPTIQFGFWEHGLSRWEAYKEWKAELLHQECELPSLTNGNIPNE